MERKTTLPPFPPFGLSKKLYNKTLGWAVGKKGRKKS